MSGRGGKKGKKEGKKASDGESKREKKTDTGEAASPASRSASPSSSSSSSSSSPDRGELISPTAILSSPLSQSQLMSPSSSSSSGSPSSSSSSPRPESPSLALSQANVLKARNDKSGRVYRVYCDGIFDLFHVGHMKMLEQAKRALGPTSRTQLIVGVCSDELTHKYKGKTVMDHAMRCESCRHCKWVDEVAADAPWVLDDAFLAKYKIDFVAHDAIPYSHGSEGDVYKTIKERGMFLETQRTDGISTSDLIVKIVRDYDAYIERNLERGYTLKQLNVGRTWEMRSVVHEKTKKLDGAMQKVKDEYKELSVTAKAFMQEFKPEGSKGREYAKRLRQRVPKRAEGVCHHGVGLFWALGRSLLYGLSYLNLFSYCCTSKKYKK